MEKKERSKVWFLSDTHFGHESILRFHPQRREMAGITEEELEENKYEAIQKHDEWLLNVWNENIKKGDTVYFLGDLTWKRKDEVRKLVEKLHGKKFWIVGNHDKPTGIENYFEWVGDIKEAKFTNNQFKFIDPEETFCVEMCHYPLLTWNRRTHGSAMVHGHCHGSIDFVNNTMKELRVDVGIDGSLAQYKPIELEELYNYFCGIRDKAGCKTFQEYNDKLMNEQGFKA